jgi:hypothetical protein
MSKRNLVLGFGAGLVAGLVTAVGWFGGHAMPKARAQAVAGAPQRFQMTTWAYHGTANQNSFWQGSFGVFILDGTTGKVWMSRDGGKLVSIGQAQ